MDDNPYRSPRPDTQTLPPRSPIEPLRLREAFVIASVMAFMGGISILSAVDQAGYRSGGSKSIGSALSWLFPSEYFLGFMAAASLGTGGAFVFFWKLTVAFLAWRKKRPQSI